MPGIGQGGGSEEGSGNAEKEAIIKQLHGILLLNGANFFYKVFLKLLAVKAESCLSVKAYNSQLGRNMLYWEVELDVAR